MPTTGHAPWQHSSHGGAAATQRAGSDKTAAEDSAVEHIQGGKVNGRWREGSRLIDQMGCFKSAGDRVTFVSTDGKLKFDCLENLAIERIAHTIGDSPDQLEWMASGVITECRGTNHLLVTQAVLKTKSTRRQRPPKQRPPAASRLAAYVSGKALAAGRQRLGRIGVRLDRGNRTEYHSGNGFVENGCPRRAACLMPRRPAGIQGGASRFAEK